MRPDALADGWNVTATILPFTVALIGCWLAWRVDHVALLIAAIAVSFVVQTHLGNGTVLLGTFAVTVAVAVVRERRSCGGIDRRSWAITAAVVAVTTMPIVIDVVLDCPATSAASSAGR